MKNEIGLNLYVTKAKVNKDGTFKELYINDEKVEASSTTELYAWKNSTNDYVYTKEIPESAGSVSIITQNPMDDATAAYVDTTTVGVYTYGTTNPIFLDIPDLSQISEPGTSPSTMEIWPTAYLATADDVASGLTEGALYMKETTESEWIEYQTLHYPIIPEDVTNTYAVGTAIANYLDTADWKTLSYVEYAQDGHISYSSDDYMRDSTKDYTLE